MKILKWILLCVLIASVNGYAKNKGNKAPQSVFGKWKFDTDYSYAESKFIRAVLQSDSGSSEFAIACSNGGEFAYFDMNMPLTTHNGQFYPIFYQVDSKPAIDCTREDFPKVCYQWREMTGSSGSNVRVESSLNDLLDEIKDGKSLTVRVTNLEGGVKTDTFTIKGVEAVYETILNTCEVDKPGYVTPKVKP